MTQIFCREEQRRLSTLRHLQVQERTDFCNQGLKDTQIRSKTIRRITLNPVMTSITGLTNAAVAQLPFFTKVPARKLFVSEPNPSWFGNGPNPSTDPSWSNGNWLKSRFHFSFAEYSNPRNSNFGVLRVMNDDLVQPKRGFGEHPHRDMEIVTFVVDGVLTHQDSIGNKGDVKRGGIQYMSAGTGVRHSEFNHGDSPLRFIQCWVEPNSRGLRPNYGQYDGDAAGRANQWQHLISPVHSGTGTPVTMHQDVNMFTSELLPSSNGRGRPPPFRLAKGRMAYLLCVEGSVSMAPGKTGGREASSCEESATGGPPGSAVALVRHDAVEIVARSGPAEFTIENTGLPGESALVLMFEMKMDSNGGRSDLL